MSERRDHTPEEDESSPLKEERPVGNYYDDDATGYEIYDPAKDDDEDEDDEPPEKLTVVSRPLSVAEKQRTTDD